MRVHIVSRDLNARARLEAVERFRGQVEAVPRDRLVGVVAADAPEVVVLDLDETGHEPIEVLRAGGFRGRIIGFYSHVNAELGRAAEAAGAEVYPRGKFWSGLDAILPD